MANELGFVPGEVLGKTSTGVDVRVLRVMNGQREFRLECGSLRRNFRANREGEWWQVYTAIRANQSVIALDESVQVAVPGGQNWVVLAGGAKPTREVALSPTSSGVVVTLLGVGAIDSHALTAVPGHSAVRPLNRASVRTLDGAAVSSGGREVGALMQVESTMIDGAVMTDVSMRGQVSLVRVNAGGTALEAAAVADVEGADLVITYPRREVYRALDGRSKQLAPLLIALMERLV